MTEKTGESAIEKGSKTWLTELPWRALTIKLESGGGAPALDARAASSLG